MKRTASETLTGERARLGGVRMQCSFVVVSRIILSATGSGAIPPVYETRVGKKGWVERHVAMGKGNRLASERAPYCLLAFPITISHSS